MMKYKSHGEKILQAQYLVTVSIFVVAGKKSLWKK